MESKLASESNARLVVIASNTLSILCHSSWATVPSTAVKGGGGLAEAERPGLLALLLIILKDSSTATNPTFRWTDGAEPSVTPA